MPERKIRSEREVFFLIFFAKKITPPSSGSSLFGLKTALKQKVYGNELLNKKTRQKRTGLEKVSVYN